MRYLIIGNSAAGIFAAETIRGIDPSSKIIMISEEDCLPYSRCLTSYYLGKEIPEDRLFIRSHNFFEETGIEFIGQKAVRLDPKNKTVYLESGKPVKYDKLLLATGASPVCPSLEGSTLKGVFQLRTLADAKEIAYYSSGVKEAVVIGAGLVGMKGAHALHELGIKVTIVEFAPQIMPQSLDSEAADLVTQILKKDGYEFYLGRKVEKVLARSNDEDQSSVSGVLLDSGKQIRCQLVLMAVGVRPNIDLAADSGIAVNKGILADETLQTSVKDIYAAGDAAETYDILWGERKINALWPVATAQGIAAGCNMAGIKRHYEGSMSLNSAVFSGVGVVSAGFLNLPEGDGHIIKSLEPGRNHYRKFILKDGCLAGMIMIGDIKGAGTLVSLIKKRIPIDINRLNHFLTMPIKYEEFFGRKGGV